MGGTAKPAILRGGLSGQILDQVMGGLRACSCSLQQQHTLLIVLYLSIEV